MIIVMIWFAQTISKPVLIVTLLLIKNKWQMSSISYAICHFQVKYRKQRGYIPFLGQNAGTQIY